MDWGKLFTDFVVVAIEILLPVVLIAIVAWLRPLLKRADEKMASEIGLANWAFFKSLAIQYVLAAEQRGLWDDLLSEGDARKRWTIQRLQEACDRYGLGIGIAEIDAAVEDAVLTVINDGELRSPVLAKLDFDVESELPPSCL